jgi:hypothetical protein
MYLLLISFVTATFVSATNYLGGVRGILQLETVYSGMKPALPLFLCHCVKAQFTRCMLLVHEIKAVECPLKSF